MKTFDSTVARALQPGQWLTFEGMRGLRLAMAGKTKTFCFRYRSPVDEAVRQIRIGSWPATNWERAVTEYRDLKRRRDDGVDPQLERKKSRAEKRASDIVARKVKRQAEVTVRHVCDRYLTEHVNVECRTEKARDDVRRMFAGRVYAKLGDRRAHEITRADAADFLASVKIDAPALARVLRSRLGGAWSHAIDRKLLPDGHANVWREALAGKLRAQARTRFLDDRELAVFLDRVKKIDDPDVRDALIVSLYTGARSGGVVGMDWRSVDLERGTWMLQDTKTDAPRTIRLPKQVIAILKARGRGFDVGQKQLATAIRENESFGFRAFAPHDLQRSARTGPSRLGVRHEVAEAARGHTQGGIAEVYNLHAFEAEVGEALQRWADHLGALQAPEVRPLRKGAA